MAVQLFILPQFAAEAQSHRFWSTPACTVVFYATTSTAVRLAGKDGGNDGQFCCAKQVELREFGILQYESRFWHCLLNQKEGWCFLVGFVLPQFDLESILQRRWLDDFLTRITFELASLPTLSLKPKIDVRFIYLHLLVPWTWSICVRPYTGSMVWSSACQS